MTVKHLYPDVEPSLNLDFANTKRLDPRITFTRASTGTYVDEAGIIRTAAANQARFDHDGSGNSLGLLIEEARTNYLANSANLNDFTVLDLITSAASTLLPDSNTGGTLVVANTANAYHTAFSANQTLTGPVTFSVFIKSGGLNKIAINNEAVGNAYCSFDLSGSGSVLYTNTTAIRSSIEKHVNGWYRVSVTSTATSTYRGQILLLPNTYTGGFPSTFAGDGVSGVYVWGAQLEVGSFPTSYIPTSGSTATRSADIASMTASPYLYGTFLARYKQQPPSGLYRQIFSVGFANAYGGFVCRTEPNGSVNIVLPVITDLTSTTNTETSGFNNVATTRVVGDYAVCLNGGTVAKSSNTSDNTNNSVITFMYGTIGATSGGHISRLTYYDRRLTDAQLQALTL